MNILSHLSDEELISRLDSVVVGERFTETDARDELIRRYSSIFSDWAALSQDDGKKDREIERLTALLENKKKEYDDLKKIELLRIRRQVQLHSRNIDLKEQIYRALQALSPPSSQI